MNRHTTLQDGARQVLRLARMLGVLPDMPPVPQGSAFAEDEEERETEERRKEQEVSACFRVCLFLDFAPLHLTTSLNYKTSGGDGEPRGAAAMAGHGPQGAGHAGVGGLRAPAAGERDRPGVANGERHHHHTVPLLCFIADRHDQRHQ